MTYTITETEVFGGRIVYKAEDDDGGIIRGRMTEGICSGTYLTDQALEQLADELVGIDVDVEDADLRDTEIPDGYSIAGDFEGGSG